MKTMLTIGLALVASALLAAPVLAWGHHNPCCEGPACGTPVPEAVPAAGPAGKLCLRAEITTHAYTVQVPVVPPPYVTKTREAQREQPVMRTVPVCVTDPITGCTRTEEKAQTVVEKVKVTTIEVCPNDAPSTVKTEERTDSCVNVYIECPACSAPAAP